MSLAKSVQGLNNAEIWVWDNWYHLLDTEDRHQLARHLSGNREAVELLQGRARCFVLGFLNAGREYYDGAYGPNQHHLHSRMGTAFTTDFRHFVPLSTHAFIAQDDESSIWTGSFARGPLTANGERQYFLFYTCRDPKSPYGLSQAVRIAATTDFLSFTRMPETITADARWYEQHTVLGDTVIHAFRDPFPIQVDGQDYLLISAKSSALERGSIGRCSGANGVIAVYKLEASDGAFRATPTPLCFAGGKPEMEVASLYWDAENGEHLLCYSAHPDRDYLERRADARGLPVGTIEESGVFYEARVRDLAALLRDPPTAPTVLAPREVTGVARNSYANRWVPELGGVSLGFDLSTGEPSMSDRQRPGLVSCISRF